MHSTRHDVSVLLAKFHAILSGVEASGGGSKAGLIDAVQNVCNDILCFASHL